MAINSGYAGSNSLSIGIALVLKDQFSNQARTASAAIQRLENQAKQAINSNLQAAQQLATAGAAIGAGILRGMGKMVSFGAEYSKEMVMVKAISGATLDQASKMDEIASNLAVNTMFNANQVASGMRYLAMAGNDATATMNMIGTASKVANALLMDVGGKGGTADLLTNIMRTFRMEGEQAAVTVGDVLTTAVTSTNTDLTDLAAAMKYVSADANMVNQSLQSTAAAIGVLGDSGIQGSMAGTALANMLRYLILSVTGSKAKGAKALSALGLTREDFIDAQGKVKDLGSILLKVREASKGLTSDKRLEYMFSIFGLRGNRAAQALLNNLDRYAEVLDKIQNKSTGAASRISDEMMNSVGGLINQMKSMWENFQKSFTYAVAPVLKAVLPVLTRLFNVLGKIVSTPLGKFFAIFTAISAVILTLTSTVALLRVRFLMLTNDSTISWTNMFMVLTSGWRKSRSEMEAYYAELMGFEAAAKGTRARNLAAMTAAGAYNSTAAGATAAGGGYAYWAFSKRRAPMMGNQRMAGIYKNVSKSGNISYWASFEGGGRKRISRDDFNMWKGSGRLSNNFGAPISRGGKFLRGAGKAMGWLSIASLLYTVIGIIVESVRGNKDSVDNNSGSTDANTEAVNSNTKALGDHYKFPDPREELIMIYNAISNIATMIPGLDLKPTIDITVDQNGRVTDNSTNTQFEHGVQ